MQLLQEDELLLERIKMDDTRALDILFNLYYDAVCTVIYYYVSNKELAEELGADVFIRLWDKRHTIEIHSNVRYYLLAMAKNGALAEMQKKKNPVIDIDNADEDALVASGDNPENAYIYRESSQIVSDAVLSIKSNTRIIFCMSRYNGLKYKEIAELLNISDKTVEHHMSKALRFLKVELDGLLPGYLLPLLLVIIP